MALTINDTGIVQIQTTKTIVVNDPTKDVKVILTVSNDSAAVESFALHRGAAGFTASAANRIQNIQSTLAVGESFSFSLYLENGDEIAAICGTNNAVNVTYDELAI